MDIIERTNKNLGIMKNEDNAINGKKVFQTEQGEFIIGQIAYTISAGQIEFSQEQEMTTINYSSDDVKEDEKRLLTAVLQKRGVRASMTVKC